MSGAISKRVREEAIEACELIADACIARGGFAMIVSHYDYGFVEGGGERPIVNLIAAAWATTSRIERSNGHAYADDYLEAAALLRDGWEPEGWDVYLLATVTSSRTPPATGKPERE